MITEMYNIVGTLMSNILTHTSKMVNRHSRLNLRVGDDKDSFSKFVVTPPVPSGTGGTPTRERHC